MYIVRNLMRTLKQNGSFRWRRNGKAEDITEERCGQGRGSDKVDFVILILMNNNP